MHTLWVGSQVASKRNRLICEQDGSAAFKNKPGIRQPQLQNEPTSVPSANRSIIDVIHQGQTKQQQKKNRVDYGA